MKSILLVPFLLLCLPAAAQADDGKIVHDPLYSETPDFVCRSDDGQASLEFRWAHYRYYSAYLKLTTPELGTDVEFESRLKREDSPTRYVGGISFYDGFLTRDFQTRDPDHPIVTETLGRFSLHQDTHVLGGEAETDTSAVVSIDGPQGTSLAYVMDCERPRLAR